MYMRKVALFSLLYLSHPLQLGLSIADRDSLANSLVRNLILILIPLSLLQYPRRIEFQSQYGFRRCEERRLCEVSRGNCLNLQTPRELIWMFFLIAQLQSEAGYE